MSIDFQFFVSGVVRQIEVKTIEAIRMSIGSTTISEVHRQLPGDVIRNETIVNGVSSSQITPETTRKCTKTHHFCMPLRNSPIQKCHFLVPQKSHRPNENEGETENDTATGKETETAPIAARREGNSIETCISSVTHNFAIP